MRKQILILALVLTGYFVNAQIHVGPGQPYADIGAASSARVIHAGDTVYIHAGTYRGSILIDSLVGTPAKWITIRPYNSDSVSILGQWTVTRTHYTRFYGLTFNGDDSASWTNGTIYHQLFFNYNYVCFNDLANIVVDSCQFMNLLTGPNKYTTTSTAGNVSVKFTGTDSFLVSRCLFHGNAGSEGLSMNGDRNGTVKNNRFDPPVPGTGSGWASHCKGGSSNITIRQNLYINWPYGGMDIGGDTGPSFFCPLIDDTVYEADSISFYSNILIGGQTCIRLASLCNSNIINNTCFESNEFTVRLLQEDASVRFANNNIYNNIFTIVNTGLGYNEFYINETGGLPYNTFLLTNNLFYSYSDAALGLSGIYQDVGSVNPAIISGSVFGNPMFNDTAMMDFSLKKGSPAIGAGLTVAAPATDYYGNPYSATARSIGAIEYNGHLGIENYETENTIVVYPNPAQNELYVSSNGKISRITITNLIGQTLFSHEYNTEGVQVSVAGLPSGVYFVKVNGVEVREFVKE